MPPVVAPFAFWIIRQAETPINGIKENIRRIVNVTKKGIARCGEALNNSVKVLKDLGQSAKKKFSEFAKWIDEKALPLQPTSFYGLPKKYIRSLQKY